MFRIMQNHILQDGTGGKKNNAGNHIGSVKNKMKKMINLNER